MEQVAAEEMVEPIRAHVLLVASDRRFRALAAMLICQRGHAVSVARRDDDACELVARGGAEVVVIDASASLTAAARQVARLRSVRPSLEVVAVSDTTTVGLSALPVLAKWSSFDEILAAVDQAWSRSGARAHAYRWVVHRAPE